MSISYNYFLPTNIYGTLRVTDLSFGGYTAVNANIYCQRNINCDGQMQCGQFHSLGTAYFDQVPTCITNATTATQLTNYQTVQDLIASGGGITLQEAIDGVHASSQQFTVNQNIWNTITIRAVGGSTSSTILQHSDTIGTFIFSNTTPTGHYRFNLNTAGVASTVLEMDSTLFKVRAGVAELNLTTVNALTCQNNATFNGSYPTTTLGANSGLNNAEFATVGYAKSIGGTSILGLNNTFTGTNTFSIPIISSGASLSSNTIPASSLVNNSLSNSQIATGFQLVSTNAQTFSGVKTFADVPILPTGYQFLTNTTQSISGEKQFNSVLPTTSLTPTTSTQLVSKSYVDANSGSALLSSNNTFTATNTFSIPIISSGASLSSNTIPASSLVNNSLSNSQIATGFQLVSTNSQTFSGVKTFSDVPILPTGYNFLTDSTQSISGEKQFNSVLPTTTLSPTSSTQLVPKAYVDANSGTALLSSSNAWLNSNTFNVSIPTTTLTPSTSTQFSTVAYTTSAISSASLLPLNNIWTGTNRYDNAVTFKNALSVPDQTTQVSFNTNLNILGTTIGNFVNWNQNGLSDSVSAGFDIFNQLNYDLYPFSTTSNITARIGTTANPFKEVILNGNVKISPGGNISQPNGTIYSTGVTTTFTTLPPYILFDPKVGMGFILPVPGTATTGQTCVIRKVNAGSTVSFTVPGNLPVFTPKNSAISAGLTALSISTVWQITLLSTLNAYIEIA